MGTRNAVSRGTIVALIVLLVSSPALFATPATTRKSTTIPATKIAKATTSPVTTQATTTHGTTTQVTTTQVAAHDERRDIIEFLNQTYGKLLASDDWMDRSLGLISLARLPGHEATETILKLAQEDRTPAVRVVAWQCLLSRAKIISPEQYKQWRKATAELVKLDAFRGQTRVGLVRMLACEMPTRQTKKLWVGIFEHTNAAQQQDIPVLDALGDCLRTWRSPDVMQFLFERLTDQNDGYRAEYVLHRAGVETAWAGERSDVGHHDMWKIATANYAAWWQQNRHKWKEIKRVEADMPWRSLTPHFVPAADFEKEIDRFDPKWKSELELGTPDVRGLDVVFVVDATGSMGQILEYLKKDVARIFRAAALVSSNPRIGLTFYRDHGDMFVTRSTRLTDKLPTLQNALDVVTAAGGADEPEAVYDGLTDALGNNPWRWEKSVRRAAILIADAPPHEPTQSDCEDVGKECKANDVKLYVVKASGAPLGELDAIARAAGCEPVRISDLTRWAWPYNLPPLSGNRGHTQLAPPPPPDPIDRQILTGLLADVINPQFRDRVEPLVGIMLSLTTEHVPEKREVFGVATKEDPSPGPGPQAR